MSDESADFPLRSGLEMCDFCEQDIYYVDQDDIADGSVEPEGWHVSFADDGRCLSPLSEDGRHLCSYDWVKA